jgi:hypothetical protein
MLDKSHATLMTFLNMREVNSMLDYNTLDIGMLDITATPIFMGPSKKKNKYLGCFSNTLVLMEQDTFRNVNICFNTNICFYLMRSGVKSSNL